MTYDENININQYQDYVILNDEIEQLLIKDILNLGTQQISKNSEKLITLISFLSLNGFKNAIHKIDTSFFGIIIYFCMQAIENYEKENYNKNFINSLILFKEQSQFDVLIDSPVKRTLILHLIEKFSFVYIAHDEKWSYAQFKKICLTNEELFPSIKPIIEREILTNIIIDTKASNNLKL